MTTDPTTAREGALLTDAEIDELLAIHSRSDVRHALIDGPWCKADYDEWPCATVRALTSLRAAREAIRAAQDYLNREDAWRAGADDAGSEKREWLARHVIFARAELWKRLAAAEVGQDAQSTQR